MIILLRFELSSNEKCSDCQDSGKTNASSDPNHGVILLLLSIFNDEGIEHTRKIADSVLEFRSFFVLSGLHLIPIMEMHRNEIKSRKNVHLISILTGESPLVGDAIMIRVIHIWKLDIKVGFTCEREVLLEIFTVAIIENLLDDGVDKSEYLLCLGVIFIFVSVVEESGLQFE
jgi:sRNA-binding carbon storage regulator CsrA